MTLNETNDYVNEFYPAVYGLVLAGGQSKRMGEDKALIDYHGVPQFFHAFHTLNAKLPQVYISSREGQLDGKGLGHLPQLHDRYENMGPFAGVLRAMDEHPEVAWLVVGCDLPFLDQDVVANLLKKRNPNLDATAYISETDGLPEPLCAIWEPRLKDKILDCLERKFYCPRKLLIQSQTELIELTKPKALDNCNTKEELVSAKKTLRKGLSL